MKESSRFAKKYRSTVCLNCNTPLEREDRYCHYCGQLNSTKQLSFTDFFKEFFGSLFSYDSRIYRTLNTLIFKPGKISLEYINGKRTKYANPFRFYLSVSIIFFLLYGLSTELTLSDEDKAGIIKIGKENDTEERDYSDIKLLSEKELDSLTFAEKSVAKVKIYLAYDETHSAKSISESLKNLQHERSLYNKWLYKRAIAIEKITDNPYNFSKYAMSKLPFIIFFFIPVFTLILWLTFGRCYYTYMEHLVFAFHSQTMLFFLMIFSVIFNMIHTSSIITILFLLGYGIYLFQALRKYYGQSIIKTFIKFVFLNVIFIILAFTTTGLAVLASFAVY
ncbi:DUF3667 domain-containing protein [Mesonia aquimarina]|uniref:DUF3667 domain-containing protein n=1 Tax=Mesonia aquimarina TaxID=1504967 RepID=UPI000EF6063A|nr:DUF3667 domain-containing protein [Mesonia aquimarina]